MKAEDVRELADISESIDSIKCSVSTYAVPDGRRPVLHIVKILVGGGYSPTVAVLVEKTARRLLEKLEYEILAQLEARRAELLYLLAAEAKTAIRDKT